MRSRVVGDLNLESGFAYEEFELTEPLGLVGMAI